MSVARSSLLMASGTILSRILGFVRAVILAAAIGVTTDAADAFGVANQLPNNVYAIIVGGLLNAVLVPQIVKARSNIDGGKGYVDRLLTLIITVFFAVTLITTLAAPLLVSIYTNGWTDQQLALATAFAYWCLPQLFFYGLYSILGEVLNARSTFGPFMWAPVLNNLVSMAGLVAFVVIFGADPTGSRAVEDWTSSQIALLAGSATAGVAAQALILFVAWKKVDLKLSFNFKWRGFGLRPALKAASWSLGMVVVTQIGGLVQTIVASGAVSARDTNPAVASVAAAAIAWLIFMVPHSVGTVSIATVYFTKMANHVQDGKIHLLKADLAAGLRTISVISVFSTVALIVLAYPISRIFVGELPATIALGNVLIALMFGLVPFSFVYMMQRAFYALEDTRTPFGFTLVQITIHVAGSLTMAVTVPAEWLVVGLSALTSVTILIQAIIAYVLLSRRIGKLSEHKIAVSSIQFVTAGVVAGLGGWATLQALGGISAQSFVVQTVLSSVLSCLIAGFVMLAIYVVTLRFLKVPEIDTAVAGIKGILRR
ncbi:murein biosynthesis integral membrane protein MurJ [Rhodoluna limnophila]|uniref:murein biosynthesis integral membrane protein MurJ n=1 Tax=Rhodoluna limnophila TaxID=232537 RepID=UPI0011070982|nr:murein biosynthesis integral membrane protein MurJ [Rhodoluna limnophila]